MSEFDLVAAVVAESKNERVYHYINGSNDAVSEDSLIAEKLTKLSTKSCFEKKNAHLSRIDLIDLVPDYHEDIVDNGMLTCMQDLIEEFKSRKNML